MSEDLLDYKLGKNIGHGTFAKVKLGTHVPTTKRVAIKILNRRKLREKNMESKFRLEIKLMRACNHPHVIRLYEVIDTPYDVFLVLEYLPGGELFEYICQNGVCQENEARRFFQQIISAVGYLHAQRIIHRDLKPENILLDDQCNVKIADFGLSNMIHDGHFLKTCCGSPNYAAPELITGCLYPGPEVDVWSSGCILYALLCGRLPFDEAHLTLTYQRIKAGDFYMPTHLSHGSSDLIRKMLTVHPVDRITLEEILNHSWYQKNLPKYLQDNSEAKEAAFDEEIFNKACSLPSVQQTHLERSKAVYAINNVTDILTMRRYNTQDYADMRRVAMSYSLLIDEKKRERNSTTLEIPPLLGDERPTPSEEMQRRLHQSGRVGQPKPFERHFIPFSFETFPTVWVIGLWTSLNHHQLLRNLLMTMRQCGLEWSVETQYVIIARKKDYTARRQSSLDSLELGIDTPGFFKRLPHGEKVGLLQWHEKNAHRTRGWLVQKLQNVAKASFTEAEEFLIWQNKCAGILEDTQESVSPKTVVRRRDYRDIQIAFRIYRGQKYLMDVAKTAARNARPHKYLIDIQKISGETFPFLDLVSDFLTALDKCTMSDLFEMQRFPGPGTFI